eukprot:12104-Heterococcus_DN1.PRE.3
MQHSSRSASIGARHISGAEAFAAACSGRIASCASGDAAVAQASNHKPSTTAGDREEASAAVVPEALGKIF